MNTNIIAEWKDTTFYDQRDKERKPTAFTLENGAMRITVTCGHIHYRPDWVMHCFPIKIDTKPLKAKNLEDAKAEAMRIVGATIRILHHDYIQLLEATT